LDSAAVALCHVSYSRIGGVPEDNVLEVFVLDGVDLEIERPRSVEDLIDVEVFNRDDEFIPYWADVWASGVELAEAVSVRSLLAQLDPDEHRQQQQ